MRLVARLDAAPEASDYGHLDASRYIAMNRFQVRNGASAKFVTPLRIRPTMDLSPTPHASGPSAGGELPGCLSPFLSEIFAPSTSCWSDSDM